MTESNTDPFPNTSPFANTTPYPTGRPFMANMNFLPPPDFELRAPPFAELLEIRNRIDDAISVHEFRRYKYPMVPWDFDRATDLRAQQALLDSCGPWLNELIYPLLGPRTHAWHIWTCMTDIISAHTIGLSDSLRAFFKVRFKGDARRFCEDFRAALARCEGCRFPPCANEDMAARCFLRLVGRRNPQLDGWIETTRPLMRTWREGAVLDVLCQNFVEHILITPGDAYPPTAAADEQA
ncbi:hypothetical protein ANO11243_057470 [Dothideomycetidae sp. 11243]|nr:hypothetical protein ANO11243_057470 [fungal sp. No.11243]